MGAFSQIVYRHEALNYAFGICDIGISVGCARHVMRSV